MMTAGAVLFSCVTAKAEKKLGPWHYITKVSTRGADTIEIRWRKDIHAIVGSTYTGKVKSFQVQ